MTITESETASGAVPVGGSSQAEPGGGRRRRGREPKIPLATPIKKDIRRALIGTWFAAFVNAFLLLLIGRVMDRILNDEPITGLTLFVLAVFVVKRAVMAWSVPAKGAKAQGVLEVDQRDRVYRSVIGQGAVARSHDQTGRVVGTGTQSVELSSTFYATFLGPIIAAMTTPLIVLIVIAIWIDPMAAGVLALFVVLIPITIGGFQRVFAKVSDDYGAQANVLSARFLDAIQGLPTLVLFNQGKWYGQSLAAAAEDVRRAIMRLLAGNQVVLLVVDAVFSLGMVTVAAWLAMTRLRDGAITPGEALSLVLLGLLLIEPLDKIGQFFYVGMSGIAGGKDLRAQLSQPVAVPEDASSTAPGTAGDGSVEFESVDFAYTPGRPVLDQVGFTIPAGQTAALVGPSGSGKTTVIALLMRFLAPDAGVIRVSGHDVSTVPADWVRQQISLVAQTTFLFHGSLRDNLLVAAPAATDEMMVQALADAALGDFLRDLPQGLDTPVGERGLSISGGQAQRIAIARAFLKDAPLLVLDEPTSNVDAESERAIVEALDRLAAGRTVLIVAHRLTTIRGADQIIVMDHGRITDAGGHDDLMARGGHYAAAMARLQAVR